MPNNNTLSPMQWFKVSLIVLAGAALIIFIGPKISNPVANQSSADKGQASLILSFGDGRERQFQGEVNGHTTILDALYASSQGAQIKFRYTMDHSGKVIIYSINDEVNYAQSKTWHFYLNGEQISSADIGSTIIKSGDKVEAKFE